MCQRRSRHTQRECCFFKNGCCCVELFCTLHAWTTVHTYPLRAPNGLIAHWILTTPLPLARPSLRMVRAGQGVQVDTENHKNVFDQPSACEHAPGKWPYLNPQTSTLPLPASFHFFVESAAVTCAAHGSLMAGAACPGGISYADPQGSPPTRGGAAMPSYAPKTQN